MIAAPLSLYKTRVKPEWVDYNNHLNDGYYLVIFSLGGVDGTLKLSARDGQLTEVEPGAGRQEAPTAVLSCEPYPSAHRVAVCPTSRTRLPSHRLHTSSRASPTRSIASRQLSPVG